MVSPTNDVTVSGTERRGAPQRESAAALPAGSTGSGAPLTPFARQPPTKRSTVPAGSSSYRLPTPRFAGPLTFFAGKPRPEIEELLEDSSRHIIAEGTELRGAPPRESAAALPAGSTGSGAPLMPFARQPPTIRSTVPAAGSSSYRLPTFGTPRFAGPLTLFAGRPRPEIEGSSHTAAEGTERRGAPPRESAALPAGSTGSGAPLTPFSRQPPTIRSTVPAGSSSYRLPTFGTPRFAGPLTLFAGRPRPEIEGSSHTAAEDFFPRRLTITNSQNLSDLYTRLRELHTIRLRGTPSGLKTLTRIFFVMSLCLIVVSLLFANIPAIRPSFLPKNQAVVGAISGSISFVAIVTLFHRAFTKPIEGPLRELSLKKTLFFGFIGVMGCTFLSSKVKENDIPSLLFFLSLILLCLPFSNVVLQTINLGIFDPLTGLFAECFYKLIKNEYIGFPVTLSMYLSLVVAKYAMEKLKKKYMGRETDNLNPEFVGFSRVDERIEMMLTRIGSLEDESDFQVSVNFTKNQAIEIIRDLLSLFDESELSVDSDIGNRQVALEAAIARLEEMNAQTISMPSPVPPPLPRMH